MHSWIKHDQGQPEEELSGCDSSGAFCQGLPPTGFVEDLFRAIETGPRNLRSQRHENLVWPTVIEPIFYLLFDTMNPANMLGGRLRPICPVIL